MIFKSKFKKGVKPTEVLFGVGDRVTYALEDQRYEVAISSGKYRMASGEYGYSALFDDDNKIYFIEEEGIVDWDGKK